MTKPTSVTVISPAMEAHVTGCADIKRRAGKRGWVNDDTATAYDGKSLMDAIMLADEALAGWFCEDPYTPRDEGGTAWAIASCSIAPCLAKAIKAERIAFDENGRPHWVADAATVAAVRAAAEEAVAETVRLLGR